MQNRVQQTKKILILGNNDVGLYKFRRELMDALVQQGHEVSFSVPHGDTVPLIEQIGCKYLPLDYERKGKNPIQELQVVKRYARMIQKKKFDVVLLYTIKPTLYAGIICRMKGIPYIANITGLSPALGSSKLLQRLCFFVYRRVLPHAQMVYFQNKENMRLFMERKTLRKGHAQLIPGSGVNLQEYAYQEYQDSEQMRILYIGRITKVKGIDDWLDAIEILSQDGEDYIFDFVGDCDEEYKERIERLHAQGKVVYHGVAPSSIEYMRDAQAVIMPSYGEGMSNVLLEASATGRPILASNVCGCREIVREGKTGFLFEPHDANSIVEAVRRLKGLSFEERRKMGILGRKYVENHFSRDIIVNSYLEQINRS